MTSVLFGDLVGFTSLSEVRDPEEVRELLSRYFDTAREIVDRYGGTIEKFIGDAVMAVWGVPTAHEDDAERAVRAGLDLTEAVAAFGEAVGATGLAMRVGVVTGEVAVTLGALNEGMVAGDAVNTASRVQTKAEPGTVWVDGQTRALADGSIDFVDVGLHELKGKAEPVALYSAQAVMRAVSGDRTSDRVQAPLVGRRRETGLIRDLLHTSGEENRPRLMVVSGDAGVGKTRLGWELRKYVDGLPAPVLWHWGRCLSYGDGVAFSALSAAVRGRIGVGEDEVEDEATVKARLASTLGRYVPDAGERDWLAPRMAALLLTGTGEFSREDLFGAWLMWFERLSQAEGEQIVWVIDDAHHADDALLDFIEHLATAARAPLFLVVLTRPELLSRRPELAALRGANVVGLETLSTADMTLLLDLLVEGVPSDARDELVVRSEGNPLYAIELVRSMLDQGLVVNGPVRTPGAVRLADGVSAAQLRALAAPASLQVLISSRLDLLSSEQRSVLAAASVLGQTFTLRGLAALTGVAEHDLVQTLRELAARDLTTIITDRLAAEQGQYAFVQAVVRAVAYQTQSRRDRLEMHLAAVAHLESLADGDAELGAVIAQHLRDAHDLIPADDPRAPLLTTRLVDWLERSALRSAALGAPRAAVLAYRQAMELATDPAALVRLRLGGGEAALAARDHLAVVELAGDIANGATAAASTDDRARAAAAISRAVRTTDRRDAGWALLEPYVTDGALRAVSPRTAARLAREITNYLGDQGSADERTWAERTLEFAERTEDPAEIVTALNGIVLAEMGLGHDRVGLALLDTMVTLARRHRLTYPLGLALSNTSTYLSGRDLAAAMAAGQEAAECGEQCGDMYLAGNALDNLDQSRYVAGRWDDIETDPVGPLDEIRAANPADAASHLWPRVLVAHARSEAFDTERILTALAGVDPAQDETELGIQTRLLPCLVAMLSGDYLAAASAARGSAELAWRLLGPDVAFLDPWILAVDLSVEGGDFAQARQLVAIVAAADSYRVIGVMRAELLRLRGTVEAVDPASAADPACVEQDLLDAIAALDAFGAVPDRARAQATLGAWLTQQGRADEAAPHLDAARATFNELRATRWLRTLDYTTKNAAVGVSDMAVG